MFPKSFAVLAFAAASLVSAQTFTECNPLEKTCPDDPAFGADGANCDFTKGDCDAFTPMDGTTITYDSNGAKFTINKKSDAPTIRSPKYIFFGRIDVVVKAAEGAGIVTSAVLQSDDLDEIDWEWVGGDNAQAQTNYYSKGNDTVYGRGAYHPVDSPLTTYHKYSVEWTSAAVNWLIDDAVVRTLPNTGETGANGFPQTPMQVKLGSWVATAEGTAEWAGGFTNFDDAPFIAYYKSISIVDYAGKDSAGADASKYVYGDKSGNWESIVIDGSSSEKPTTTKSATKTTTKAASKTSTTEEETETSTEDKTTKDSDKTTKTADHTTLTTKAASTTGGSKTTDASSTEETGDSASATTATSSSASETISTVPTNAASSLVGSMGLAVAGLFAVQFLI